jgi:glucose dehydrogenase
MSDYPTQDYDAVVIGAGIAGAMIAWKLAQKGLRVVMLEAGEGDGERERVELVGNYARAIRKTTGSPYLRGLGDNKAPFPDGEDDYYVQEKDAPKFKSTYLRRAGGSTWHFLGNVPRFIPADFRLRSLYGVGVDWPIGYDDLEEWYGKAEKEMGVSGDHAEWNGLFGAHRTGEFPMSKVWQSYSDEIVKAAIEGKKFEDVELRVLSTPQARNSQPYQDRPACAGNSTCVPICPIGAKYDGGVHVRLARQAGAELQARTIVRRLEVDRDGRIGAVYFVRWDGSTGSVRGRIVVLAAHAVESPKLLLLSRGEYAPENGVANSSGQVGLNLMDHLQGQGGAILPQPVYPFRGPPTTSGIDAFRDGGFRSTRAAFRMSLGNDAWGRLASPRDVLLKELLPPGATLFGTELRKRFCDRITRQFRISYSTEMLPSAENRVTLSDQDDSSGFGIPRPKLAIKLDSYNLAAFDYAQRVIDCIFDLLGATEKKFPEKGTYSGAGHIMGTCRMGDNPKCSVADRHCRSHDHANLFIAGASLFPTGGTANPTLTAAALALRLADMLLAEFHTELPPLPC